MACIRCEQCGQTPVSAVAVAAAATDDFSKFETRPTTEKTKPVAAAAMID